MGGNMKNHLLQKTSALVALALALSSTACSKKEELEDVADSGVKLQGKLGALGGQQKLQSSKVVALAASEYKIICSTLTADPQVITSLISDDGSFLLSLPANVPFSCFLSEIASQEPVATFLIPGVDTGFGSTTSSSLALNSDIDLGSLNPDLEAGEIAIPENVVAPALATFTVSFNPQALHNATWEMTCALSGDAQMDQACQELKAEGESSVFLRIINAQYNGEAVTGLGVWSSEAAFQACGSIDLANSDRADIESNGYVLDAGVATAHEFTADGVNCQKRDPAGDQKMHNIRNYYAAGRLQPEGDGYTLYAESEDLMNPGCKRIHKTVVHFRAESDVRMVGQFNNGATYIELNNGLGDCSGLTRDIGKNLVMIFTKVQ